MNDVDVIVVGAGPTGLMLSCELALAGVRVRLLERRAEQSNLTRAFAVHARTLELLDARGVADQLVSRGLAVREITPVPGVVASLNDLPSRYPMILIAPQTTLGQLLLFTDPAAQIRLDGTTTVVPLSEGRRQVTVVGTYTLDSTVDPARAMAGQATVSGLPGAAYPVRVSWDGNATFEFSPNGQLISASGYP